MGKRINIYSKTKLCFLFLRFNFISKMQQKGTNLKTTPSKNIDVPKNGLTAMIAAIDSNGCVMKHVHIRNQLDAGQKIVIELSEKDNQSPNLYPYQKALAFVNNNVTHQTVRNLQSSPKPLVLYPQENNNMSIEVNCEKMTQPQCKTAKGV